MFLQQKEEVLIKVEIDHTASERLDGILLPLLAGLTKPLQCVVASDPSGSAVFYLCHGDVITDLRLVSSGTSFNDLCAEYQQVVEWYSRIVRDSNVLSPNLREKFRLIKESLNKNPEEGLRRLRSLFRQAGEDRVEYSLNVLPLHSNEFGGLLGIVMDQSSWEECRWFFEVVSAANLSPDTLSKMRRKPSDDDLVSVFAVDKRNVLAPEAVSQRISWGEIKKSFEALFRKVELWRNTQRVSGENGDFAKAMRMLLQGSPAVAFFLFFEMLKSGKL